MIFLLEYDRPQGHIVTLRSFAESQRREAENQRLEMELTLHRSGVEHEVVLLDAQTEEALRRTHRRYFEDLKQMVQAAGATGT